MPLNAALRAELPELVPNGLLVTRSWLMEQGLARHAVDNLVKSGQLLPLRPGVYIRPGSRLVWQGVVGSRRNRLIAVPPFRANSSRLATWGSTWTTSAA